MGILLWMLALGIPVYIIARLGSKFWYSTAAIISLIIAFSTGSPAFIAFDLIAIFIALMIGTSHTHPTSTDSESRKPPIKSEHRVEDVAEIHKTPETNKTLPWWFYVILLIIILLGMIF